jgi:hypothetical protein
VRILHATIHKLCTYIIFCGAFLAGWLIFSHSWVKNKHSALKFEISFSSVSHRDSLFTTHTLSSQNGACRRLRRGRAGPTGHDTAYKTGRRRLCPLKRGSRVSSHKTLTKETLTRSFANSLRRIILAELPTIGMLTGSTYVRGVDCSHRFGGDRDKYVGAVGRVYCPPSWNDTPRLTRH